MLVTPWLPGPYLFIPVTVTTLYELLHAQPASLTQSHGPEPEAGRARSEQRRLEVVELEDRMPKRTLEGDWRTDGEGRRRTTKKKEVEEREHTAEAVKRSLEQAISPLFLLSPPVASCQAVRCSSSGAISGADMGSAAVR
eukprot:2944780-Rhodomonas_salina.1